MTRRLPSYIDGFPAPLIGLVVGVAMVGTVAMSVLADEPRQVPRVVTGPHEDSPEFNCLVHGNARCGTAHLTCLAAAARPYDDGFAPEVCDVLADGATFVPTGEVSYAVDGGMVTLPPLAESIADSCGDADLRECVTALIRERQEAMR